MGRRKTKAQAKLRSIDEDASDDNVSLETETSDLKDAVGQHRGDGASHGEADAILGATPDDDKSNSEDDQKPKTAKKKEYKGNKLKIQGNKQKKTKTLSDAHDGSQKPFSSKLELNDAQSDGGDSIHEDEGAAEPAHKAPIEVLYCPFCTFPAEMCEFGGMMDKCRPWLLEHAPEFADADNLGRKRRILTEKEHIEAMIAGKGIKKALERHVVLELESRSGKRKITTVTGMNLFGFNLKDLSKEWRKTFSCGVGVRDATDGVHQDCIDIQGDVTDKLVDILLEKFKIPKEAVYRILKKKKVKYFDDTDGS
ncbi:unnamed protein product [Phytomonas sp. Hart1]|nr:unnamed protein product [Phytomonas sp. Hart1]|eukprot:CCW70861.1 unnamed protein product [Phytomonas sp. isolate Hart1]